MERYKWNSNRFAKWEEETHIPEDVQKMVDAICTQIGISVEEITIEHRNRGGYTYGYSKGYEISYCTSSIEAGPSVDMAPVFMKWLKGLGFRIANSYGDNGLDSDTNWHDTYWYTEISYEPTMVEEEAFIDWLDEE